MFKTEKNPPRFLLPIVFLLLFVALIFFVYRSTSGLLKNFTPEKIINLPLVQEQIKKQIGEENQDIFNLMPGFLGFDRPKYYLILFLNNTELRPAGGFIGSYALIKVDKGQVNIIKVEGTELLDMETPDNWKPIAPEPITKYLGVDRWYFRDSNWSPDFSVSAKKALEFYIAENGLEANKIDGILGITTDVLEELLKKTGPITVEGIEFNSTNAVEKLEYYVEHGYVDRGLKKSERKEIMKILIKSLLGMLKKDVWSNPYDYLNTFIVLIKQKHIIVYSVDDDVEKILNKHKWSGELSSYCDNDYLLWTDANLGALKTDYSTDRKIFYEIISDKNGKFIGRASMKYIHNGNFDWRTTRYLSYTRIFVPIGSELISIEGDNKSNLVNINQGEELNRKWFGAYISIEPKKEKTIVFNYLLPEKINQSIKNGWYQLCLDKQLGTDNYDLTINLDFDKNIKTAFPAEKKENWSDDNYFLKTNLSEDKLFKVEF